MAQIARLRQIVPSAPTPRRRGESRVHLVGSLSGRRRLKALLGNPHVRLAASSPDPTPARCGVLDSIDRIAFLETQEAHVPHG
jgi:hypothetical protein